MKACLLKDKTVTLVKDCVGDVGRGALSGMNGGKRESILCKFVEKCALRNFPPCSRTQVARCFIYQ